MIESKSESNLEYFKRRHEERRIQDEARTLDEQRSQQKWQLRTDDLVQRFDPEVKGLLTAFAEVNLETADYHIFGPEKLGHQVNWSIEYNTRQDSAKSTILVVLHYLHDLDGAGQFVPDCFSMEGLEGLHTIRPPTIEALRKALGDAKLRP